MLTSEQKKLSDLFLNLAPLSADELDMAFNVTAFHRFDAKSSIFSCGKVIPDIHFVLNGIGRYFYLDEHGNEWNKSLVQKGGAFACMSSLVEGAPSPFFTEAITPCLTASITYEHLIEFARHGEHWHLLIRRVFEQLVLKKEKREAAFLLLDARARYKQFLDDFGEMSHRIPLRHVAMYIGVTDVSLSRIRKEMGLT